MVLVTNWGSVAAGAETRDVNITALQLTMQGSLCEELNCYV
jgi:hypothetical protein